ncbi:hypothetical protein C8R44DRAFT_805368 [Mycena epipterygia]|nr:hypothetical protein C8R44DRAFT_805368 [Mycena epipterygia]
MGFGDELQVFAVLLHIVALWISISSQVPSRHDSLNRVDDATIVWMILDRARRHGLVARSGIASDQLCPAIGIRSPRGISRTRWRVDIYASLRVHYPHARPPTLRAVPRPPRFRNGDGSSPDDANDAILHEYNHYIV